MVPWISTITIGLSDASAKAILGETVAKADMIKTQSRVALPHKSNPVIVLCVRRPVK
jgi:hypothetical protein